jgi:cell filamentation protein
MLIHPFREGNGRVGRLLAVLMAFQAGLPGLDFTGIRGKRRKDYFAAVQAGLDRDYEPMKKVFKAVLSSTRRKHAPR